MRVSKSSFVFGEPLSSAAETRDDSEESFYGTLSDYPTVLKTGFTEPSSSGAVSDRTKI